MNWVRWILLAAAAVLPMACGGMPKGGAQSGELYEAARDGRIYVVGSEASLKKVQDGQHLPYTRTLVNYGPNGATVVIEADKEGDALESRLRRAFAAKHGLPAE